jgi:hypothetical protein
MIAMPGEVPPAPGNGGIITHRWKGKKRCLVLPINTLNAACFSLNVDLIQAAINQIENSITHARKIGIMSCDNSHT